MPVTIVETPTQSKNASIFVRTFVRKDKQNMGLEKWDMALFDGIHHSEQLAAIERNGIKRYLTGLNEFAPEIKLIADPEVKAAKIKEIRATVAQLEKDLAANIVNPDDEEFWNKIKLLKPDNSELWDKIEMKCGNTPVPLNPEHDSYDLIKVFAIEAGGFPMIAKSYEDAMKAPVSPKFYLDKQIDTISHKTEYTKIKNKALAELQKLFDKNQNKLFYVAKVLDANSAQYKRSTPNDIIYANMDSYIVATSTDKNMRKAAQGFLDISSLDMETLKLRAVVKDATFYKFIALRPDGFIYDMETSSMMGRTPSECVEYLKNPLNEAVLTTLMGKTEKYWNK
jgi:hypothetical protein